MSIAVVQLVSSPVGVPIADWLKVQECVGHESKSCWQRTLALPMSVVRTLNSTSSWWAGQSLQSKAMWKYCTALLYVVMSKKEKKGNYLLQLKYFCPILLKWLFLDLKKNSFFWEMNWIILIWLENTSTESLPQFSKLNQSFFCFFSVWSKTETMTKIFGNVMVQTFHQLCIKHCFSFDLTGSLKAAPEGQRLNEE